MDDELNYKKAIEIEFKYLETNELTFNKNKNYQYISLLDDLNIDTKNKLIDILKDKNSMPYNYLNFIYQTYIEYTKEIINEGIVPQEILEEYKNNKFGLLIKLDKEKTKDQQLVFYCTKNQNVLKQFFLAKNLNGEKEDFNLDNLEIHSKSSEKSSKNSKHSKTSINEIKDNKICSYISGHIFEEEVIEYLRSKLIKLYIEIPNVFYSIKNDKNGMFYNEFDAIFKIDNKLTLNRGIVRINCIFTNDHSSKEFSDFNDKEIFEIPGKSLLFIEVKKSANFEGHFPELFAKIKKYRNLINDIYNTSDYQIIILYFYNNLFISSNDYFEKFKTGITKGKNSGESYPVYSFYIYDNIYLFNKLQNQERLENELIQTK